MKTQSADFATVTKNGIVTKIGRSIIIEPKLLSEKNKKPIKWFDDSKLLKTNRK